MVTSSSDQINTRETEQRIWAALRDVKDPEIPTLSLIDLNVVRGLRIENEAVTVVMTPTFAGCPALEQMKSDIVRTLSALGWREVHVETVLTNAWSTDLLTDEAKHKLEAFGIAPPPLKRRNLRETLELPVACPFCGSLETRLENPFGATLCKQLYYCSECSQSFERFKPL